MRENLPRPPPCPRKPRPSLADVILDMLRAAEVPLAEVVEEAREIQTLLGLAAAGTGRCIVPLSARQVRSKVRYRLISDAAGVSPVILSHRTGDRSPALATVRDIIAEIYAENLPRLGRRE